MVSAPQPDQEMERIRAAIVTAREKLSGKADFDLSPLTGALEGLCERIAALPMEAARGYADGLQSTLQLLQALEDDISRAHDELQQRMAALGEPGPDGEEGVD